MLKLKRNTGLIIGVLAVLGMTVWVLFKLQLITGFPKGVDSYAHLTRIAWILTRFPQISWNPSWDSGTFFWLWSYPPVGPIFSALLVKLLGLNLVASLTVVSLISVIFFSLGFYLTCATWAGPWLAIPISLLVISVPAVWSWWGHGGNYIRIWGMGFFSLALFLLMRYLVKPQRRYYLLLVLVLGLALSTHMLFTALTVATLGGFIIFFATGFKAKAILLIKTLGVGLLITAFWYIPMALSTTGGRFLEESVGGPVLFSALKGVIPVEPFFSLPLIFTVFMLVFVLLGLVVLFFKKDANKLSKAAVITFLFGLFGAFAYAFGRNFVWFPKAFSASGFAPFAALPFVVIFAGFLASGTLGVLFGQFKNSIIVIFISLILSGGLIFIFWQTDFSTYHVYDMTAKNEAQPVAIPPVKSLPLDANYRFGTDSAFVSDWFNFFYPNLPQTRDYIYQGIPYKSWQYFLEYSFWTQEDRLSEAQWLADWYGIKYFTVGLASGNTAYGKFSDNPQLFENKYSLPEAGYFVFEYKFPQPIIQASNSTPVLVVGGQTNYEILVRSLALSNLSTGKVVPVYAGRDLSKLSQGLLQDFPVLFLYRPKISANSIYQNLISRYLSSGGRVVVEADVDSLESQSDWLPIEKLNLVELKRSWGFSSGKGVLTGLSESKFSQPVFSGGAWKAVTGTPKAGSEVLLNASGAPVIVRKQVGKGEIIWSGLNLPYHAESFRNSDEVYWLGKLMGLSGEEVFGNKVETVKNEPEKRVWKVAIKAKGLVWKESWFPRWRVTWTDSQGKKGKLVHLMAGPALSYLPLPQDATYPIVVSAKYHPLLPDYLGWTVTVSTLVLLIIYGLKGNLFDLIGGKKNVTGKLKGWWNEEE